VCFALPPHCDKQNSHTTASAALRVPGSSKTSAPHSANQAGYTTNSILEPVTLQRASAMSSSGESYGHESHVCTNSDAYSFAGEDSFTEAPEQPLQDDRTTARAKNGHSTAIRLSSMIPQTVQSLSRWPVVMDSSPWAAYISQNSTPLAQTRLSDEASIDSVEPNPSPKISLKQCMTLVERYLNTSNMENPILDPIRIRPLVSQAYLSNFRLSIESCLALLVCANGAISTPFGSNTGPAQTADSTLADALFRFAEQRLGMAFTAGSVAGAQCLYLSGVFHMCKSPSMNAPEACMFSL
jgi:hypothetical protein